MNVHNYVKMEGIPWVDRKINGLEAAVVLYCNGSSCASVGIPSLLPLLARSAVHHGRTTAGGAPALQEQRCGGHADGYRFPCLKARWGSSSALAS